MTNEPVDIARRRQAYHTMLMLRHNTCPNLITDKLRYHFASITAMFFLLTINTKSL